jgi:hypothetical protein
VQHARWFAVEGEEPTLCIAICHAAHIDRRRAHVLKQLDSDFERRAEGRDLLSVCAPKEHHEPDARGFNGGSDAL